MRYIHTQAHTHTHLCQDDVGLREEDVENEGRQYLYLSNLPPVKTVKEVVRPPLVGVGLQCGLHAWRSRDPNPLLFVVPPVPVKATDGGERQRERELISGNCLCL